MVHGSWSNIAWCWLIWIWQSYYGSRQIFSAIFCCTKAFVPAKTPFLRALRLTRLGQLDFCWRERSCGCALPKRSTEPHIFMVMVYFLRGAQLVMVRRASEERARGGPNSSKPNGGKLDPPINHLQPPATRIDYETINYLSTLRGRGRS